MGARGFTLTELLTVLTIAGLLLAMALSSLGSRPDRDRAAAALNQMIGAVRFARAAAVIHRVPVTLCPAERNQCAARDQWHRGALIFRDLNQNGVREAEEALISALPGLEPGARLYWRSFRNRSYLRFLPRGYTQWQNGHFLYCPRSGEPTLARMIIVNAQGRTRIARDRDQDGVVEDAKGRPVACP